MDKEEAMKILKDFHDKSALFSVRTALDTIIPELAESEDKKIMKEIAEFIYNTAFKPKDIKKKEKWLAWLEKQGRKESDPRYENLEELLAADDIYQMSMNDKMVQEAKEKAVNALSEMCIWRLLGIEKQGERKSTDNLTQQEAMDIAVAKCFDEQNPAVKVEPKFKNGQWIVFNGLTLYVNEVVQGYYRTTSIGGIPNSYDWNIDNAARLWSIEDAKDGDVLVNGSNIFMFHFINDTRLMGYCHVNTDNGRFYDDIGKNECFCLIDAVVNPATKEQRDLLFQKMNEAGYTFDFEKKGLKIIEPKPKENKGNIGEISPKWSEEDENILNLIIARLHSHPNVNFEEYSNEYNWLNSLKGRVQPKQEWSGEDERAISIIKIALEYPYNMEGKWDRKFALDWLKSFKAKIGE